MPTHDDKSIQWNPSNPDTNGPESGEVSGVEKYTNMVHGDKECVLPREASLFQRCPYRGVPLYSYNAANLLRFLLQVAGALLFNTALPMSRGGQAHTLQ